MIIRRAARRLAVEQLELVLGRLADLRAPVLVGEMAENLGGDAAGLAAQLGEGECDVVGVLGIDDALLSQAVGEREGGVRQRAERFERAVARAGRSPERMAMALQGRQAVLEARLVVPGRRILEQQQPTGAVREVLALAPLLGAG